MRRRVENKGLASTLFKLRTMKPGDFIVFRQDLPYFGMGYLLENLRVFLYLDLLNLPRQPMKTTAALIGLPIDIQTKEKFKAGLEEASKLLSTASFETSDLKITPEEEQAMKQNEEAKAKVYQERADLE